MSRFAAASIIGLASSCSLVYDLSPDQCGNNRDCEKFGEFFACESGVCVDQSPPVGGKAGSGGGGRGGSGNDTGMGGGDAGEASGGTPTNGGTDTGGTGGTETGGTGGTAPEIDCKTHKDCFAKYDDTKPWACVENVCHPLETEECPYVLPIGDDNYNALRETDAIIIGAFARVEFGPQNGQMENINLALSQISDETGGIPGAANKVREVVAVVCGSTRETQSDLLVPLDHLIQDLKVPAILATLPTADQEYVFRERAFDNDVFMMIPNSSDDDIVNLKDEGLVYHMLAGPESLSVTYQPLIEMTIGELQKKGKLGAGPDYDPARIALVTNLDDRFLVDLGAHFEDTVEWNGLSAADNADATPKAFASIGTHFEEGANQLDVVDDILALAPHIIVSASYAEMTNTIMPQVELKWDDDTNRAAQGKPFYVLSPFNYGFPTETLLGEQPPGFRQRILGIGWPATLDSAAYKEYKSSYTQAYGMMAYNYDLENFYDATYFLIYGMVAAGSQIRGATIAAGMPRITAPSGTAFNVGLRDVSDAFAILSANNTSKINLTGANGRPEWNLGGGRIAPASVWCIDNALKFVPDVLKFDEGTGSLTGALPTTCFTFPTP